MADSETEKQTPIAASISNGAQAEVDDSESFRMYGSGWAEATIDGKRYRLRRPLFGELADLRKLDEELNDEINTANDDAERFRLRFNREHPKITEALETAESDEEVERLLAERKKLRAENMKRGRETLTLADANRLRWWQGVFEKLSVDGIPDKWPGWIVDAMGAHKIMQHWRDNPLARG